MDAAGSGAAPWEWDHIAKQEIKEERENLKKLSNSGEISRAEIKNRKAELFGT